MLLIEAMEAGHTELGKPDKVIETILAKLFFFGDIVVKIYKHRDTNYGDMRSQEFRKLFYIEDFNWNNVSAPHIYRSLHGYGSHPLFEKSHVDEGEDWAIEMRAIDTSTNLTKALVAGEFDTEKMQQVASAIIDNLERLTKARAHTLPHIFDRTYLDVRLGSLDDLEAWLQELEQYVAADLRVEALGALRATVRSEPYFSDFKKTDYRVVKDTNSDNILYIDGKPAFLDIMPPNEAWRVNDPQFCLMRTEVDAEVLGNPELRNSVRELREKAYGVLPKNTELVYELHGALIQLAYRHMLGQHDIAERYRDFVNAKLSEMKTPLR